MADVYCWPGAGRRGPALRTERERTVSIISEIRELTPKHMGVVVLTMAATVAVGTLTLFRFHRELFFSLDWFRFILLAVSIPLPSLLINIILVVFLIAAYHVQKRIDTNERGAEAFILAAYYLAGLYSSFAFVVGLFLSYWRNWSFLGFALFVVLSHVLLIAALAFAAIYYVVTDKARKAQRAAESAKTETPS